MANERKLTPEVLEKCKEAVLNAESADEILAFTKQNGIELSSEKAADLFARYHKSGEISDNELDNVAGGGCKNETVNLCPKCGREMKGYMVYESICLPLCPVCDAKEIEDLIAYGKDRLGQ